MSGEMSLAEMAKQNKGMHSGASQEGQMSSPAGLNLPDAYTDGQRVWLRQDLILSTSHVMQSATSQRQFPCAPAQPPLQPPMQPMQMVPPSAGAVASPGRPFQSLPHSCSKPVAPFANLEAPAASADT